MLHLQLEKRIIDRKERKDKKGQLERLQSKLKEKYIQKVGIKLGLAQGQ